MMTANNFITASFNFLAASGVRASKQGRRNFDSSRRPGGNNELIEEWPSREIDDKRSSKKHPPTSIDIIEPYMVLTRQEGSDIRTIRRNRSSPMSSRSKQHRYDATKPAADESSCADTLKETESLSSLISMEFSAFSLNDMPSTSSCGASVRSRQSKQSICTAPNLHPDASRRRNHDVPTRGRRQLSGPFSSTASMANKKSVRFSDEVPSVHRYAPLAPNTHYSDNDDEYFRQHTITLARGVMRILQTSAVYDESFDKLTGLPSPTVLKEYLNHPDMPAEEIVGIEDLLAGPGVASARKRLKKVQERNLLSEQRRQLESGVCDPKLLARSLRKTSAICANIARCRASYAAAMLD